jgi:hypothetical protein
MHALAYDSARGRVVLFGGFGPNALADTWEWDGAVWLRRTPANSPPARAAHALAYDSARGRVVLFGGYSPTNLSDTWEWDGTNWVQRFPRTIPQARAFPALAYDSGRGRVVLFGGNDQAYLSDTWEWDGTDWTQSAVTSGPSARIEHALAYDGARGRVVLFGGNVGGADTWEWNGAAWLQRAPTNAPPPQQGPRARLRQRPWPGSLVRGAVLLRHLGVRAHEPAEHAPFGIGCAGSAGTPALAAASDQRPWVGEPFTLELTRLPANAPALFMLGSSKTSWGAVPLPFALDPLGMPGCAWLVAGDLAVPAGSIGGTAQLKLGIPADAALIGRAFFDQALVADPPANALGITASNATAGRIGAK